MLWDHACASLCRALTSAACFTEGETDSSGRAPTRRAAPRPWLVGAACAVPPAARHGPWGDGLHPPAGAAPGTPCEPAGVFSRRRLSRRAAGPHRPVLVKTCARASSRSLLVPASPHFSVGNAVTLSRPRARGPHPFQQTGICPTAASPCLHPLPAQRASCPGFLGPTPPLTSRTAPAGGQGPTLGAGSHAPGS